VISRTPRLDINLKSSKTAGLSDGEHGRAVIEILTDVFDICNQKAVSFWEDEKQDGHQTYSLSPH
jgi:hypothetical protein